MKQHVGEGSWSNIQLCFIFIGMTLLFAAIRWDTEAWVQGKLNQSIAQYNLNLTYHGLALHGTSLQLYDVHVQIPNIASPLQLDEIQLQLDWSALWHARLAVLADIKNDFMHMNTVVSMHDTYMQLSDMVGQADVHAAQAWYGKASLAQGRGELIWQGDVSLDINTGLPTETDLQANWQTAGIYIMQQDYTLGDYVLKLTQSDNNQIWSLQGGEQLKVQGHGLLQMNHSSPLMWPLQGNVDVQASKASPLAIFLAKKVKKVKIMGVLGQPRWAM